MYQVKDIDGKRLINGYEIAVIGNLCKVNDGNGKEKFVGSWDECVKYCRDRSLLAK